MVEETFAKKVAEIVAGSIDGGEITTVNVPKNNGVTLTGISIRPKDSDIAPTIYLEGMEKLTTEEAAEKVIEIYERRKDPKIKLLDLMDWEKAKDRVIYTLINKRSNLDMLKDTPHRDFLDLAMIFRVLLDIDGENKITSSVTIKNGMIEKWGVDTCELLEAAKKNTIRDYPAKVAGLQDILTHIYASEGLLPLLEPDESMNEIMFVITNDKHIYGAASILYPGVVVELAERLKCDLILIPSSIHEWIAVKAEVGMNVASLNELVKNVNISVVDETEVLSNSVYFYSRKYKWITNGMGDIYRFNTQGLSFGKGYHIT